MGITVTIDKLENGYEIRFSKGLLSGTKKHVALNVTQVVKVVSEQLKQILKE